MSAPAHTQALETLVEAHAGELHLPAIRARFGRSGPKRPASSRPRWRTPT
jgi:hypothetical protein